jgi:hypothetical protein
VVDAAAMISFAVFTRPGVPLGRVGKGRSAPRAAIAAQARTTCPAGMMPRAPPPTVWIVRVARPAVISCSPDRLGFRLMSGRIVDSSPREKCVNWGRNVKNGHRDPPGSAGSDPRVFTWHGTPRGPRGARSHAKRAGFLLELHSL